MTVSTGLRVDANNIRLWMDSISFIGRMGNSEQSGYHRAAYSDEETKAIGEIVREAKTSGLGEGIYDAVGNLFLKLKGKADDHVVQVGSHLDTVPKGGTYDGAAGVVAGLEAIRTIYKSGPLSKRGLELVVWRGEEGAVFSDAYKGSKGAFGMPLSAKAFETKHTYLNGKTMNLEEALKSQGLENAIGHFRGRIPTIGQGDIDNIFSHLELHIDQGDTLEAEGKDIGIVESIRGNHRFRIVVEGEFNHSGATEMRSGHRRDANVAMAHMVVKADEIARIYLAKGKDIVLTPPQINTDRPFNDKEEYGRKLDKNALTKISGFGYFTLDVRSNRRDVLEECCRDVREATRSIGNDLNVKVEDVEIGGLCPPVERMDERIQRLTKRACEKLGYGYHFMSSGAGHDAAIVSQQKYTDGNPIPTGMVFIPCRDGRSHDEMEFARKDAIVKGANVLTLVARHLATAENPFETELL